eukprot:TRINITY_DN3761_c0_g1_i1.p1 TRINITY_DN3761_c0_g1~~TRINITY_DN3761_c0_g1_i1.p1  ORF type:complete len:574 (-),score=27.74 TRINITY_DN3761_c0_g1_i1:163-1827(-)
MDKSILIRIFFVFVAIQKHVRAVDVGAINKIKSEMNCTIHFNVTQTCQIQNLVIYRGEIHLLNTQTDLQNLYKKILNYTDLDYKMAPDIPSSQQIDSIEQLQKLIIGIKLRNIEFGVILQHFYGQERYRKQINAAERNFLGILVHWMLCGIADNAHQLSCDFSEQEIEATQMIFVDDLKQYQGDYYKQLESEQSWGCFSRNKPIWLDVVRFESDIYVIKKGILLDYSFKIKSSTTTQQDRPTPYQFIQKIWAQIENSWYQRIRTCAKTWQNKNGNFTLKEPDPQNFLFIGILSTAMTMQRREMVRTTWVQWIQYFTDINYKFIISQTEIDEVSIIEKQENDDFLFVNIIGDYDHLSYKVFELIRYFLKNNTHQFLFKTDDDAYVLVPRLYQQLRTESERYDDYEYLYIGFSLNPLSMRALHGYGYTVRQLNQDTVHFEYSMQENKSINYMQGCGYVITRKLADKLLIGNDEKILTVFNLEDFTLKWQMVELNLEVKEVKWNQYMSVHRRNHGYCLHNDQCNLCKNRGNQLFVLHKVYPLEMLQFHKEATRCKIQ